MSAQDVSAPAPTRVVLTFQQRPDACGALVEEAVEHFVLLPDQDAEKALSEAVETYTWDEGPWGFPGTWRLRIGPLYEMGPQGQIWGPQGKILATHTIGGSKRS